MQHENENYMDIDLLANEYPFPTLENLIDEKNFIAHLVVAGNRLLFFLKTAASLVPARQFDKLPQGILLGHMVRLAKLYDSFLLLISENRSEAAMFIARAITDTSIKLKFFIRENVDQELCDKFVKSSLSYDKKLWEFVRKKIGTREPEEFEKRILIKIESNFSKTKFKIEDIDFKKDKKWCADLSSLSETVGLSDAYETMYRLLSGSEHGSWGHLEQYHLKEEAEFYQPELLPHRPDPQLICAASHMCIAAAMDYADHIGITDKTFVQYLEEVLVWFRSISDKYDEFKNTRIDS